jgi:DNA-binding PucR family transcriptional regulator
VYRELVDTSRYLALADIALGCAPPGGKGVSLYDDHPSGTLIAGSPDLAARLARLVLGPVLDLAADERDELLHTLTVWLDEGGSTSRASERLFCHRNTVRNRLQRIEHLTGRALAEPRSVTELCLAVDAHALLGPHDVA